ncbi:MAG: dihydrolipoyllysine-residue acetyltransferase [Pseudomonadota bacterium]
MSVIDVKVPDIGGFDDVPVIEILVKVGDSVQAEESLLTLESDKATMEVPAPQAGTIKEILVKVGDKISEGTLIVRLESAEAGGSSAAAPATSNTPVEAKPETIEQKAAPAASAIASSAPATSSPSVSSPAGSSSLPAHSQSTAVNSAVLLDFSGVHASPSVRRFSRELGVDLRQVSGSAPKGRITKEDVTAFVKTRLSASPSASAVAQGSGVGLDLLPWPKVDFAKFGAVEVQPLSRIKKISGANLWRNWVMIPHVTQFDDADITDLEAFRVQINQEQAKQGTKLTMLAFLMKACVAALKKFPEFNSSLDGDQLVLKKYYHIGFAADTPQGLVVPVIRDADQKGVAQLAKEMGEMAAQARDGKLKPTDMQGGTFTISSLGGIGGTAFTPIVNAPEVAILGVSRSQTKPVWDGKQFQPRLMLPLSLSYDHRVVDGASGARFASYIATVLADYRRILL